MMASAKGGSLVPTQGWEGSKSGVLLAKAVQERTAGLRPGTAADRQGQREPARLLHGDELGAGGEVPRLAPALGTQKLNPAAEPWPG